jgi:hypothetical protein
MKRIFQKPLLEQYDKQIAKTLPQFERMSGKPNNGDWPIARAHVLDASEHLYFFVLMVYYKYDDFAIHIAWNVQRIIPPRNPSLASSIQYVIQDGQASFCYPLIISNRSSTTEYSPNPKITELKRGFDGRPDKDDVKLWYRTELPWEIYQNKIDDSVRRAVAEIADYAVPYFESVSGHFGCPMKIEIHKV